MSDTSKEYNFINEAKKLINDSNFGILSTLSVSQGGYPFGSLTPYIVDGDGSLIILISDIAEHTKNIKQDSKVSITILEKDDSKTNIQTLCRVTYLGDAILVEASAHDRVSEKYLSSYPDAASYFNTHGFKFYSIKLQMMRFIGGFGKIHWISPEQYV